MTVRKAYRTLVASTLFAGMALLTTGCAESGPTADTEKPLPAEAKEKMKEYQKQQGSRGGYPGGSTGGGYPGGGAPR